jgi:hypothetical protein
MGSLKNGMAQLLGRFLSMLKQDSSQSGLKRKISDSPGGRGWGEGEAVLQGTVVSLSVLGTGDNLVFTLMLKTLGPSRKI